jgi:hypothetical protein
VQLKRLHQTARLLLLPVSAKAKKPIINVNKFAHEFHHGYRCIGITIQRDTAAG